jgi:hypothetical protein
MLVLAVLLLTCFDLTASAVIAGRWDLVDYDDPKHHQIGLWLLSGIRIKNPAPTNAYDAQGLPLLTIQCLDGRPEFFINLNFEVPTSLVAVTYRLDEGAAVDATWKSEGITITTEDKVGFVRSLVGKRKLSLIITFPGATPTSTAFEITGLDVALPALRPRCSW